MGCTSRLSEARVDECESARRSQSLGADSASLYRNSQRRAIRAKTWVVGTGRLMVCAVLTGWRSAGGAGEAEATHRGGSSLHNAGY